MTSFVELYDVALLDLDGTVYVGPDAVPHAVESLNAAASGGMRLLYTTNNAARTPEDVASQLRHLGLSTTAQDVVTSSVVAAQRVLADFGVGAKVLAVGGPGVGEALAAAGLDVVGRAADRPVAVVQGYGPDVSWRDLAEAAFAINAGARHIATNLDLTIPTSGGIAPGNGTLVRAVVTATGVDPVVTGKPFRTMFDFVVAQTGARRALVIGDRLDTDIEGGRNADLDTLHVLTGVDGVSSLLAATPEFRPTYIARDLRALFDEPTMATVTTEGSRCRDWVLGPDAVDDVGTSLHDGAVRAKHPVSAA